MMIPGFLICSPKFNIFSHTPLRFMSNFRVEITDNRISREKLQQEQNSIRCLYDEMRRMKPLPSVVQFTQLLSRLVKLEEYSAAVRLYRDFCCSRIPINEYTMSIAANSYSHLNRVDFGFSILGSTFKRGCVPNAFTYTVLLKGLFRENRGDEALELFKKIVRERLCELNTVVYGVVIDGLRNAGGVAPAMELNNIVCLYDEMRRTRPLPSVNQFTQLLSHLVKLEEYSAAVCLYRDFCCLRIPINACTLNIAANSYSHLNRVDFGFSILGSFFKRGCVPDAFTYTALLKGLFRENRGIEALELFEKITREKLCELDVVLYGVVIDGMCKAGGVAPAMELLRTMEKGSCKPKKHIYNMVIDALCRHKLVDSAFMLFDEMSLKGIRPDVITYNSLIHGMCSLKRWEEVYILLKQMVERKVHPDVVTFNSLIKTLCNEGLVGEVEHELNIMKQLNVVPDLVTYATWMHGYCMQARLDDARKVFDSMAGKGITPDVQCFSILIDGYCKNIRIEEAMHLFQAMNRKGLEPDACTYNSMLHGLFRGGRCTDARKLFEKLQTDGIKPSFRTYITMLDGLFHTGHFEEALLLLDQMEQKGDVHINYYNVVMNAFCEEGELDKVRAIFNGLGSKGLEPNVVTYGILIKGCCQHGLLDDAKDIVLQMRQTSLMPNSIIYNCITQACLKRGEYDTAAKFIEEMDDKGFSPDANTLELVFSLPGTVENNPTLLRISRKLAPETFGNENMGENVL